MQYNTERYKWKCPSYFLMYLFKADKKKIGTFRVFSIALSAFIFTMTEFVPIALLTDISHSFNIEVSKTGLIITIYAWIVAIMSLPFMLLTSKIERKSLLLYIFSLFIVSHIFSVFAWNFTVLVISRIGVAIAHAIFWAITASLIVRVASKNKKTQALGILAAGTSLSTVLGLPIGRMIGEYLDWRATFSLIALLGAVSMFLIWKLLPRLPSKNAGSINSLPILLKRRALLWVYLLTMFCVTAHFTAYSYIEPYIQKVANLSSLYTTVILLTFGIAGLLGSFLFSRYNNRYPIQLLMIAISVLFVSLFFLLAVTEHFSLWLWSFVWGTAIMLIGLSMQIRVLLLASDATDAAMAVFSGIFNVGIGGGALIGNQVIRYLSLSDIGYVASIFAFMSLLIAIFLIYYYRSSLTQTKL